MIPLWTIFCLAEVIDSHSVRITVARQHESCGLYDYIRKSSVNDTNLGEFDIKIFRAIPFSMLHIQQYHEWPVDLP